MNVFNISTAKSFSIPFKEGIKIEFRADAQNVFNHPSYAPPGNTTLGGSSGPGTAYGGAPGAYAINGVTVNGRDLQLALKVSF